METWEISKKKAEVQEMLDVAEVCLQIINIRNGFTNQANASTTLLISNIETLKARVRELRSEYEIAVNKDTRGW